MLEPVLRLKELVLASRGLCNPYEEAFRGLWGPYEDARRAFCSSGLAAGE